LRNPRESGAADGEAGGDRGGGTVLTFGGTAGAAAAAGGMIRTSREPIRTPAVRSRLSGPCCRGATADGSNRIGDKTGPAARGRSTPLAAPAVDSSLLATTGPSRGIRASSGSIGPNRGLSV